MGRAQGVGAQPFARNRDSGRTCAAMAAGSACKFAAKLVITHESFL